MHSKTLKVLVGTLFLIFTLSGCTVLRKASDETTGENGSKKSSKSCNSSPRTNANNIECQLLAAAQSIEQSLGTLAAAEKAENPPILNTAPLMTPEGGMGIKADVDWTGPIGPLVVKIAKLSNYRVKFLGQEPAIPILVSITVKRTPIADILQNASFQAGKRAHILVFPSSRLIEVRYLSP